MESSSHSSRKSPDKKREKSETNKSKPKNQKKSSKGNQVKEEVTISPLKEIAEKTLSRLSKLGNQTFAFSPFNPYFDDWLKNVRNVISEFESNHDVTVDIEFTEARKQIIADVELELAEKKLKEASLLEVSKVLSETNHTLAQLESDYSAKTRTLSLKKSTTLESSSLNVNVLKEELVYLEKMKTSFFSPLSKRIKAQKITETTEKLEYAQSELGIAIQNFKIEQEKLYNQYMKDKQATLERAQTLKKEVENIDTDGSIETRKTACNALSNAINNLLQRKEVIPQ
jgi:hypothetical protein